MLCASAQGPLVLNSWPFTNATNAAYSELLQKGTPLDAVEAGCKNCEAYSETCFNSVGHGGDPDENCEVTLDAMIMDGTTMKSGAVANLRRVERAVSVARAVLEHTTVTILAGDQATDFAVANGFSVEDLWTSATVQGCTAWRDNSCQPNYRINITPNPAKFCGPYSTIPLNSISPDYYKLIAPDAFSSQETNTSHDTISVLAIDGAGTMAAATSTNGQNHKIPGRVGDGPITGSASYVDNEVAACGATGDGDVMMRFLPCYQAVESMRRGMTPQEAADDAVRRMLSKYPEIKTGLVVVDKNGTHAGAASGWSGLPTPRGGYMYAYWGQGTNGTQTVVVQNLVAK